MLTPSGPAHDLRPRGKGRRPLPTPSRLRHEPAHGAGEAAPPARGPQAAVEPATPAQTFSAVPPTADRTARTHGDEPRPRPVTETGSFLTGPGHRSGRCPPPHALTIRCKHRHCRKNEKEKNTCSEPSRPSPFRR